MNQLLTKLFVKIVCPQVSIRISDDEINCYDSDLERIYFNPNDTEDCGFLRHLREVHNYPQADRYSLTIWTLLHEIGHYNTLDDCDDDEEDLDVRLVFAALDTTDVAHDERAQDLYFNLQAEWEATEWAIAYLDNHKLLCSFFSFLLR